MSSDAVGESTNLNRMVTAGAPPVALWPAVLAYLRVLAPRFMKRERELRQHIESDDLAELAALRLARGALQLSTPSACKRQIRMHILWAKKDAVRRYVVGRPRTVNESDRRLAGLAEAEMTPRVQIDEIIAQCQSYFSEEEWQLLYRRLVDEAPFSELQAEFNCSRTTLHVRFVQAKLRLSEVAMRLGLHPEA